MAESKPTMKKKDLVTLAALVLVVGVLLIAGTSSSGKRSVSKDLATVESKCAAPDNNETCYAKAFETITTETDRDYAFTVLRELQKTEPAARGCHFIAHAISIAETRKDPSKWRELMNSAPQDCSYGASHGVLEVYASTFPDGKLPASEVPNICNNPDTNNCTHILGHLLLVMNDNNIPKSTALCNSLPNNAREVFECLTGVFMERITAFNLVEHGLADKSALNWPTRLPELTKLCNAQTGTNSVACWKEITHVALVTFNNDPQKIVDFCETAPGETQTRECIDHAIGIMAGSYNFQIQKMGPICEARATAADYKTRCYANLVSATLSTVPQNVSDAVSFCTAVDTSYQSACFTMIGNSLYRASPDNKTLQQTACASAPEQYRSACQGGGNNTDAFHAGT
jgi:hypothetical protein